MFSGQDPPRTTSSTQFVGPTLSWLHFCLPDTHHWLTHSEAQPSVLMTMRILSSFSEQYLLPIRQCDPFFMQLWRHLGVLDRFNFSSVSFTTKAVKASTDSCQLVMQRVSTAERSTFFKLKTNQTKKREIIHLTEGSDLAPHAAGGIFCCASVGGNDSEKGETACGRWRQRGGENGFISLIRRRSLNRWNYFYHDIRHMLRNHRCFNS